MLNAVILAGGRGTRLGRATEQTPKPLIKIVGVPIIERQIKLLKRYGVREVWVISGYLGDRIQKYLDDGSIYGLRINHIIEQKPQGTGGALKTLEGIVKKDFILLSGDVVLDIDFNSLVRFHKKKNGIGTVIVHPSDHPFDSDLVEVDSDNKIKSLILRKDKKQSNDVTFRNLTCTSSYVFSPQLLNLINKEEVCDLEKDIFPRIFREKKQLFAYNSAEYIKDVGTPERLKKVEQDVLSGKVGRLNKKNKRPAIFLDRDGVINEDIGHLKRIDDIKLLPGSGRAIRKINDCGFLAIVVTNQAVVAHGTLTEDGLREIHNKLETLLAIDGAKIDGIYYCPHHPDKGFKGESQKYKIKCDCRKPKIGLIKKAVKDFNINLRKSYFIGDTTTDAKTARNAGIKFIGVSTGYSLRDNKYKISNKVIIFKGLLEAVNVVLL